MTTTSKTRGDRRRLARVLLYYAALAALVIAAIRLVPGAEDLLAGGTLTSLVGDAARAFGNPGADAAPIASTPGSGALLGTISMLGALLVMVPVTWIYMITRRHRGFDESVVHTLLILPVAVTGIVMIVQHSLPLAFSLAGIVAAVRFRTTLDDTKDAVYVFLAIGVGLASGVQAFGLALMLSIFFNAVILLLWMSRFANVYASAGPGELTLGDALAGPHTASSARLVGDASILDAAAPADIAAALHRAAGMERHLAEERARKKTKRANALLLVCASRAEPAQALVEETLDALAGRWRLAEIQPGDGGGVVLEYLVRLEQPGAQGAVLDRLRAASGVVDAAELRVLSGLGKRA